MQRTLYRLTCATSILVAWSARAQGQAPATVVQLPTFDFFTVSTTVSVPDSGGAFLGGVRRVSTGSTAYGPPRLIGRPRELDALGIAAEVRTTIHRPPPLIARLTLEEDMTEEHAAIVAGDRGSSARAKPQGSFAQARRLRQAELALSESEGRNYYQRGLALEAQGKLAAARAQYRLAARIAGGELKQDALSRLNALLRQAEHRRKTGE